MGVVCEVECQSSKIIFRRIRANIRTILSKKFFSTKCAPNENLHFLVLFMGARVLCFYHLRVMSNHFR